MFVVSMDIGIRHLAYCSMEVLDEGPPTALDIGIIDLASSAGTGHSRNMIDASTGGRLVRELDVHAAAFVKADVILIEKQPPIAKLMRVIQGMLEVYFICNGKTTVVYDGRRKLPRFKTQGLSDAEKYRQRKKAAVQMCDAFLRSRPDAASDGVLDAFERSPKKDDLADAIIQALNFADGCPKKNL
jgi:hypothetical protein